MLGGNLSMGALVANKEAVNASPQETTHERNADSRSGVSAVGLIGVNVSVSVTHLHHRNRQSRHHIIVAQRHNRV